MGFSSLPLSDPPSLSPHLHPSTTPPPPSLTMASSNIKPSDNAVALIDELFSKKKHNYIIFKIVDETSIEVEDSQVAEAKGGEWDYDAFAAKLSAIHEPRFALVSLTWKEGDGRVVDKVVFIGWNPDGCKVRQKMLYGSGQEPQGCAGHRRWRPHSGGHQGALQLDARVSLLPGQADGLHVAPAAPGLRPLLLR